MALSEEVAVIHVCQGPPRCSLEGDDAVAAQESGCRWCRQITVYADGSESISEPYEDINVGQT